MPACMRLQHSACAICADLHLGAFPGGERSCLIYARQGYQTISLPGQTPSFDFSTVKSVSISAHHYQQIHGPVVYLAMSTQVHGLRSIAFCPGALCWMFSSFLLQYISAACCCLRLLPRLTQEGRQGALFCSTCRLLASRHCGHAQQKLSTNVGAYLDKTSIHNSAFTFMAALSCPDLHGHLRGGSSKYRTSCYT